MTTRRRLVLGLVVVAGAAYAVTGEYYSIHRRTQENHFLDLLVGLSLMAAGVVSRLRRPDSRVGLLLGAGGIAWFFGNYANAGIPWLFSFGHAFDGISVVPIVHAVISYPSGRLQTRIERGYIATFYAWLLFVDTVTLLTFDPHRDCRPCIRGGLAAFDAPGFAAHVNSIDNVLSIALPVAGILLLALRFRREPPAVRHALLPLWIASGLLAAAFVAQGVDDAFDPSGVASQAVNATQRMMNVAVPLALMFGLLRLRLVRSSVGDMIVTVGERPGSLREALAKTLGDPHLLLAYRVQQPPGWVDVDGQPLSLPADPRATTVLYSGAEPIAALVHDPILADQRELVQAAAAAARLAIENERLRAEVRAQLEEVRASRARIVEASDAERQRVERDLHDGAQQRLLALSLALRMAEQRLGDTPDPALKSTLAGARTELDLAINEIRELARGIHPAILTDEGLAIALESLADRAPIPTRLLRLPAARLQAPVEVTAYYVVSEAIVNAAKHSGAVVAEVDAHLCDGVLRIRVSDNGNGQVDVTKGTGLRGLADRVAAVGGELSITSADGAGTCVEAEIPCE